MTDGMREDAEEGMMVMVGVDCRKRKLAVKSSDGDGKRGWS